MKEKIKNLTSRQLDAVVQLAWHDRTSFDVIEERTGLTETEVIFLMRRELEPRSFKNWRKRVSGRITKHRKILEEHINPGFLPEDDYAV